MQGVAQSSLFSARESERRIEALAQEAVGSVAEGDRAEYLAYMRSAAVRIQVTGNLLWLSKMLKDVSKNERHRALHEILSYKIPDSSLECIIVRSESLKEVKKKAILALGVDAWSWVSLKMPRGPSGDQFLQVVNQFKAFTQDGFCLGNIGAILLHVPENDKPMVIEYMKSALTKVNVEKLKRSENNDEKNGVDNEDEVRKLVLLWSEIPPDQFLQIVQWMDRLLEGMEGVESLPNIVRTLIAMKCDRDQAIIDLRELIHGMTDGYWIESILKNYEIARSKIRSPEDLLQFQTNLRLAKEFAATVQQEEDKVNIFSVIMRCGRGSIEKLTYFKREFLSFISTSSDPSMVLTDLLSIPLHKCSQSFIRGEEFLARLGLKNSLVVSKTLSSWVNLSEKDFDGILTILKELKQVTDKTDPREVKSMFCNLIDKTREERAQLISKARSNDVDQLFNNLNLN